MVPESREKQRRDPEPLHRGISRTTKYDYEREEFAKTTQILLFFCVTEGTVLFVTWVYKKMNLGGNIEPCDKKNRPHCHTVTTHKIGKESVWKDFR